VMSSWSSLIDGSWISLVNYWRTQGVLQCLPIFCMALSCQAQVFEIYDGLPNASPETMGNVVKNAVNLCSASYICIGFFGYVTFCTSDVGGNILTVFAPGFVVQIFKLGFVLSVAVSFPLIVFPCRTSIHSLLFRKGVAGPAEALSNYIPPTKFNVITVGVLGVTLFLGVMIPDIEFVLGIVGSTIGSAVGIIFPSLMFIRVQQKNTMEKFFAQIILVIGVGMMVVGTYSNLNEANRSMESIMEEKNAHIELVEKSLGVKTPAPDVAHAGVDKMTSSPVPVIPGPDLKKAAVAEDAERREPVVPYPPKDDDVAPEEKLKEKTTSADKRVEKVAGKESTSEQKLNSSRSNENVDRKEIKKLEEGLEKKVKKVVQKEKELEVRERKADELLQELQKQKDEQKQLIEEQKEVLQQMKEHVNEEQAKDQASHIEGKSEAVSQASREQEEIKLGFKRLPSDNVIPASAIDPNKNELPKPSPRGPILSPEHYQNPGQRGQLAGMEVNQPPQVLQQEQGQTHNQSNMSKKRAQQDGDLVHQQHENQRLVVESGGLQKQLMHEIPRDGQGEQNQLQIEQDFDQAQKRIDGGEEKLYRIPNRGNQRIPENGEIQRKSNDPLAVGQSRADAIDDEVGVGRDLKSMARKDRT